MNLMLFQLASFCNNVTVFVSVQVCPLYILAAHEILIPTIQC